MEYGHSDLSTASQYPKFESETSVVSAIKSHETGFTDREVEQAIIHWMKYDLKCAAGRREFNRGHYMIAVAEKTTVSSILDNFKLELALGRKTACLMAFNSCEHYAGRSNVEATFRFLADSVTSISSLPPEVLVDGKALSFSLDLACPVTNKLTKFDDFECIAFCPQSSDMTDPLYDPLMFAPFPAVNIASDVYGFSRFVAESALQYFGRPTFEVNDHKRLAQFFAHCVERWHRLAVSIIEAFAQNTNVALCPVHLSSDNHHWVAAHKDPAFAEIKKELHIHELPKIYASRIAEAWLEYLCNNRPYATAGMSREGTRV